MEYTKYVIVTVVFLAVAAAYLYFNSVDYSQFGQCLSAKGVKFYGAFWCPHCADQKAILGSALKNVTYVECSTPDGKVKLQVCKDAGVKSYPTWEFEDGTMEIGVFSLEELSAKSGCALK